MMLLLMLGSVSLWGQSAENIIGKFRKLNLESAWGKVPVMYSAGDEKRALRYQKRLIDGLTWFEEQLGIQVPAVLIVADKDSWAKADRHQYPQPHCYFPFSASSPGAIVLPARMEDFPGGLMFPEVDMELATEMASLHEAGHLIAYQLGIGSDNLFVEQLVANVFPSAHAASGHPELKIWKLPLKFPPQRYTALADMDYLRDLPLLNEAWLELKLQNLADVLVEGEDLRGLMKN